MFFETRILHEEKMTEKLKKIYEIIEGSVRFNSELQDPEKCEQIYILITDVLDKKLNEREITFLRQHQKKTENEIRIINDLSKKKISWIKHSDLEDICVLYNAKNCHKHSQPPG